MSNKFIIITSIFYPTRAVKAFSKINGYKLIVVGDNKTPKDWQCDNVSFYSIDEQKRENYNITKVLPENHYCRKMLGYIKAIKLGTEIIIDTDDDNIPKPEWEFPSFNNKYLLSDKDLGFINIYKHYTNMNIWPRGLPLDCIKKEQLTFNPDRELTRKEVKVGIWQGLADGDPDVDAIYRLVDNNPCYFNSKDPIVLNEGTLTPFNSQNTAFIKELFPLLYLPAYVTFRFTDILRGLVAQPIMWLYGYKLGFINATVIQERNEHDYLKDFESEIPCYLYAKKVIEYVQESISPNKSIQDNLYEAYNALYKKGIVADKELETLSAWLKDIE